MGKFALVDDCDAHLKRWKWFCQPRRNKDGCAYRSVYMPVRNGRLGFNATVRMHHCIIGLPLNPGICVDHINGDPLDNRRSNLRFVTNRQNSHNRVEHRGEKRKSSKYIGVSFDKSRGLWEAYIQVSGKRIHLGRHATEDGAAAAYQAYYDKVSTCLI